MKVFISYAREDIEIAKKLRDDLEKAGIKTWLDKEDLLPGQKWRTVIRKEIRECSHFLAVLSSKSLSTRGFVQKELKMALDMLGEFPEDEIFVIPVRIEECEPGDEQLKEIHWADLFPSYEKGFRDILRVLGQNRQNGNVPDSQQKNIPEKKETVRNEDQPSKTESSEEKSVLKTENKREITAGDAEKSVLVSGDGNVINIIHQYEPKHKKAEQNEEIKLDEPVKEDSPPQPPKEGEKSEKPSSDTQSKQKRKSQRSKIITAVIVVSLLSAIVIAYMNIPKFVKSTLSLRNTPIKVSDEEARSKFKLNDDWRPLEYIRNDFKDNGNGTTTDHATGLLWQKSGSPNYLSYKEVPAYIKELNDSKFAGYNDWRLPTVEELNSLLTPNKRNGDLNIDPIFDKTQRWCWAMDKRASGGAWGVSFYDGGVIWGSDDLYVRAVRLGQ